MARLFNRGLLPFGIWEQLLEAEAMMDAEVHEVQAEAEKLQKGWGQGVFGQAYQMLRKEREVCRAVWVPYENAPAAAESLSPIS